MIPHTDRYGEHTREISADESIQVLAASREAAQARQEPGVTLA
jgi:hypothetical protein